MMGSDELVQDALDWVRRNSRLPNVESHEVEPDSDLLGTGLLDSIGLVELLVHVQDQLGCNVALDDADPSDFSSVASICRYAVKQSQREKVH